MFFVKRPFFLDKEIEDWIRFRSFHRFRSFSGFPNYQDGNFSVDHFLPSNWPVDHFSSSISLLSFLWLLWFTLAQSYALVKGVLVSGNAFGLSL